MSGAVTKAFWSTRNILLLSVAFGVPILLFFGGVYALLSPREWAFGMIAWITMLIILVSVLRAATRKVPSLGEEQKPPISDAARRSICRDIWKRKVWIGVLVILLPVGIADGIVHRAWLPTLVGIGISLTLMYIFVRQIKQQKEWLNLAGKQ